MLRYFAVLCLCLLSLNSFTQGAQDAETNSNLWPVHRDQTVGFRISYPPNWVIVPARGPNVRFSVNPPDGPGNCNVVARPSVELRGMTQEQLDREVEALPNDQEGWSGYVGIPAAQIVVIESRRARIIQRPALLGVLELSLENLEGKFTRKAMVALTLSPGTIWTLNCGATSFKPDEARSRFAAQQSTFSKVFGTFIFLQ